MAVGDIVLIRIYYLLMLMIAVVIYHYKSYTYYDEKVLKSFGKKVLLVLGLCALGFNLYLIYETFFSIFDRIIGSYGSFSGIFIDCVIFIFAVLGAFEIIQLHGMIKRVEEKVLLTNEIDDIGISSL
ncbi:hypothetical protein [uncultured Kordia sp.]|uniref:hypothetical protein n=1 Tax=uncultured Kordia sp. TaxID=507699 RepID=UPI0026213BB7|nr:hypothetical protein [uncultured Kordia sp.]